jgi:hypothetical protein
VTAGERLYVELGEPGRCAWARLPLRLRRHYAGVAAAVVTHHLHGQDGPEAARRMAERGYEVVASDQARTAYERRTA